MTLLLATVAAIVGIFVGGVLNWLADYLPDYEIPAQPRYPDGTPRPPIAWLGLTAFLADWRCPGADRVNCLPWRYPLTEIATALAFFITVLRIEAINVNTPQLINGTQSLFHLFYVTCVRVGGRHRHRTPSYFIQCHPAVIRRRPTGRPSYPCSKRGYHKLVAG